VPSDEEPGALEALRQQAHQYLLAATSKNGAGRLAAAHAVGPSGARGNFLDVLDFLSLWVRDLAAAAEGAEDLIVNTDARTQLSELARTLPGASQGAADALKAIEYARGLTTFNINPQLALASVLNRVGAALRGTAPAERLEPSPAKGLSSGG
jgi:hypothetical protein